MSQLQDDLLTVVDSLEIHSPDSFSLWGVRYEVEAQTVAEAGLTLHPDARSRLQSVLYSRLHCRIPLDSTARSSGDRAGLTDFLNGLSEANRGKGTWQPGWVVRGFEGDSTIAEHHGVRFWVANDAIRTDDDPPVAGSAARVKVPKEGRNWVPGFYWVLGDADQPVGQRLVRVYWNVTARGSARLTEQVTTVLNAAGLPFYFKVVNDPALYDRVDSAVLYLSHSTYQRTVPAISEIYQNVAPILEREVSVFVKRLAPGLGLAEDSGTGKSFGLYCCGLIADGLSVEEPPSITPLERCETVFERLRAAGLDPECLYLNPGSADVYTRIDVRVANGS